MKFIAALIVFCAALTTAQQVSVLNEFKTWKLLDYKFPSDAIRQQEISNGNFVASNAIPIDVAVDYRGKFDFKIFFKVFPGFFEIPAIIKNSWNFSLSFFFLF